MSGNQITLPELMEVFAEIFEVDADDLLLNTRRDEIEGWDSMGVLSLMAEYDSRFGITLTTDQLESFETINDLINVLKESGFVGE